MVEPIPTSARPPSRRRTALAVAGLAAFALALPLVRVLADGPEFFLAHHLGPAAVVGFWLLVCLVVPAAAGAAAVVPLPGGRTLRRPIVAVLGAAAGAGILQPVSSWAVVFWLGTVAIAVVAVVHVGRTPAVTDTLAVASVGCLLLAGWALGPSRTGRWVRAGSVATVAVQAEDPAPLVVVVFDELPLTALLDRDLEIDAGRFPNLAALAATSDWYRLAAAGGPNTASAVPALLSGTRPRPGSVPVASEHPANLFLQVARTHDVHGFESLTALCPPSVCHRATGDEATEGTAHRHVDLGSLASDLSVVLQHALATDDRRDDLPSLAGGWAGFVADGGTADHADDGSARHLVFDGTTFDRETEALLALADAPARDERPLALVAHVTAPHAPWTALPGGNRYALTEPVGSTVVDGVLHWQGGEPGRRAGYQRLVLQLGALDEVVGELRHRLEARGLWDEAAVVVTADHGTGFEPGYWRDLTTSGVEVSAVPLLVKAPGQHRGRIDDRAATTADLLPTLLGLVGVRSPSELDGLDLGDDDVVVPRRRDDAFVTGDHGARTPEQSLAALAEVVERRATWIDPDGGWAAVAQPGIAERLVGRPLDEVAPDRAGGGSWARAAGQADRQLTVSLAGIPAEAVGPVVASCRGTVLAATPWDGVVDATTTLYLALPCPDEQVAVTVLGPDRALDLRRTR